jgi:hypothetical protein
MSDIEPAGVPAGGSDLSADDAPTSASGTAGADAPTGDAGVAGDNPVTGDEPFNGDDDIRSGHLGEDFSADAAGQTDPQDDEYADADVDAESPRGAP